jgi:hypothetical protein
LNGIASPVTNLSLMWLIDEGCNSDISGYMKRIDEKK